MGVEIALVIVRKDELTGMPDFMNQGIDIAQTACPAHEDIRVHAIWIRRITTRLLATISSKVYPALFLVTGNFLSVFLTQWCD